MVKARQSRHEATRCRTRPPRRLSPGRCAVRSPPPAPAMPALSSLTARRLDWQSLLTRASRTSVVVDADAPYRSAVPRQSSKSPTSVGAMSVGQVIRSSLAAASSSWATQPGVNMTLCTTAILTTKPGQKHPERAARDHRSVRHALLSPIRWSGFAEEGTLLTEPRCRHIRSPVSMVSWNLLWDRRNAIGRGSASRCEAALRRLMRHVYREACGENWLDHVADSQQRGSWRARQKLDDAGARSQKGVCGLPEDEFSYSQFSDLLKIAMRNWTPLSPVFPDREETMVFMRRFTELRNPGLHGRPLYAHESTLLQGISGQIRN